MNLSILIPIIVVILAFVYLLQKLNKIKAEITEIKKDIEELDSFKAELINITGSNAEKAIKNISEYLSLKNRHFQEDLYMLIGEPERVAQIDKEVWRKRQEEEHAKLFSTRKDKYVPSFPAK